VANFSLLGARFSGKPMRPLLRSAKTDKSQNIEKLPPEQNLFYSYIQLDAKSCENVGRFATMCHKTVKSIQFVWASKT